jgi:hypothetical protein
MPQETTFDQDTCSFRANQLRTVLWSLRSLLDRRDRLTQRNRFELRELATLGVQLATELTELASGEQPAPERQRCHG